MASGLTPWLAFELPEDPTEITAEMLDEWRKKQKLARLAAAGCNILFEEIGLRRRMNFYYEFKKSSEWKNLGFLKTVRMGKEILKKDVSKAYNEVKATSRAHDKQVSLNTNSNYNMMQATKPWAPAEDVVAFGRGRGSSRGRTPQGRGGGRSGNGWNPRNNFNAGGSEHFSPPKPFNRGRGQFPSNPRFQRGGPQGQQPRNNNNNGNNSSGGYPQKSKPQNKSFRGGGNN
jgi:hypothetical protein